MKQLQNDLQIEIKRQSNELLPQNKMISSNIKRSKMKEPNLQFIMNKVNIDRKLSKPIDEAKQLSKGTIGNCPPDVYRKFNNSSAQSDEHENFTNQSSHTINHKSQQSLKMSALKFIIKPRNVKRKFINKTTKQEK